MAGVGCGITYSVMPMYLGEVSSKKTRGPLGSIDFGFFLFFIFLLPLAILFVKEPNLQYLYMHVDTELNFPRKMLYLCL